MIAVTVNKNMGLVTKKFNITNVHEVGLSVNLILLKFCKS